VSVRPLRALLLLALAIAVAAPLAGCGNKLETRTLGQTEGLYIDVGQLKYQVQLSRILNPSDIEDSAYLEGLTGSPALSGNEAWFGVWMRVENTNSDKTLPTARDFSITDTQGHEFKPVPLKNHFAFAPSTLGPNSITPNANTVAGEGVIQGSLILFKVTTDALASRPLELHIRNPTNAAEQGIVDLDV
jgi:hypothetical protein